MRLNFDVSNENDDENFKVTIAANVSLDDAATLENLPYQNELENGKRNVGADVKEAVMRKQVLSKAAKRYEPKANGMRAPDEVEIAEAPVQTMTMTDRIIIHLMNDDVMDRMYERSEMVTILGTFAKNNFANAIRKTTNDAGSLWLNRMKSKGVIVPADGNKWSINKNYNI